MPVQMECVYCGYKARPEPHNSQFYCELTLAGRWYENRATNKTEKRQYSRNYATP